MNTTDANVAANIQHLTDTELFELCREYGTKALTWRKKFIGLLPEVNRRKLYERKGFASIFEFAAKLCGLSQEQVRLTLNLEKRFSDKPTLNALLVNGEVSVSKLAKIASIATPENEEELAMQLKVLPRSAIETLVRDEKCSSNVPGNSNPQENHENASGQKLEQFEKSLASQTAQFQLADDVQREFNELHSKGIDVNELLREMLKQRKEKIAKVKEEIAASLHEGQETPSRYIPVRIKKILKEEHGTKCSIKTCKKPAEEIHHTQRFSLSQNHDPKFLAPLCVDHHIIAHSVDNRYHRKRELATCT